jgi:hypothetical protein
MIPRAFEELYPRLYDSTRQPVTTALGPARYRNWYCTAVETIYILRGLGVLMVTTASLPSVPDLT